MTNNNTPLPATLSRTQVRTLAAQVIADRLLTADMRYTTILAAVYDYCDDPTLTDRDLARVRVQVLEDIKFD